MKRILSRIEEEDKWRKQTLALLQRIARRVPRHEHDWHLATWFVRHPRNTGVAYWICPCGDFKEVSYQVMSGERDKDVA